MIVEKVLASRERYKKSNPDEKCKEYLVKIRGVKYGEDPDQKWILRAKFPTDEVSTAALSAFRKPLKKRKHTVDKENDTSKPAEKKLKTEKFVDSVFVEPKVEPKIEAKEPPKQVELKAVPAGHSIVSGCKKTEVSLPPNVSLTGPAYTITNGPFGYRVVRNIEFDIQFLAEVKDENKKNQRKWISAYSLGEEAIKKYAKRNLESFPEATFNEIIQILPCGQTFVVEVKTANTTLWIDENQLKKVYLGKQHQKMPFQEKNRKVFNHFLAQSDKADAVIRYVRSKRSHPPPELDLKRKVHQSQIMENAKDVVFEEKDLDLLKKLKESMAKYDIEDGLDATIQSRSFQKEPDDLPSYPPRRESLNYEKKQMPNWVLETRNECFSDEKLRTFQTEYETQHAAYDNYKIMFDNAESFYESNKNKWKEEKDYESVRQARWNKDEARKAQAKQKKISDAYTAKAEPHHKNINYNSSEAQKENDDTEYMFTLVELPYKSSDDLKQSKKAERKLIEDHAIFNFLNWKDGKRQIRMNDVESAVLCKRREFNPEP